jgi:actin-related protein
MKVCEIFFNPKLVGKNCRGLIEIMLDAVMKCDIDKRLSLFDNIVMTGNFFKYTGTSEF